MELQELEHKKQSKWLNKVLVILILIGIIFSGRLIMQDNNDFDKWFNSNEQYIEKVNGTIVSVKELTHRRHFHDYTWGYEYTFCLEDNTLVSLVSDEKIETSAILYTIKKDEVLYYGLNEYGLYAKVEDEEYSDSVMQVCIAMALWLVPILILLYRRLSNFSP